MENENVGGGLEVLSAIAAAPVSDAVIVAPAIAEAACDETEAEPTLAVEVTSSEGQKPKRKRRKEKAKAKVVKVAKKAARGRGRPKVYTGKLARYIVSLVRKHGATTARKILNATARQKKLIELRNLEMVPKALGISMPTLLGLAKNGGVKLRRGRPALKKAA